MNKTTISNECTLSEKINFKLIRQIKENIKEIEKSENYEQLQYNSKLCFSMIFGLYEIEVIEGITKDIFNNHAENIWQKRLDQLMKIDPYLINWKKEFNEEQKEFDEIIDSACNDYYKNEEIKDLLYMGE